MSGGAEGSPAALVAVPDAILSRVLDHTVDGLVLVNDDQTIVYANQAIHRLLGYEAGTMAGLPLDALVPEESRHRHRRELAHFQKKPIVRPMGREGLDIEARRADGSTVPVDIQLDAPAGLQLTVATVRDMTAERESSVDRAIDKLDLAAARRHVDGLQSALDLVIQRLFALGASMEAGAANEPDLSARLNSALHTIDEVIEAVQKEIGRRVLPIA